MVELDRSMIRSVELFAKLADAELEEVLALGRPRHLLAGQAVFEQGEAAAEFFVLLSGRLKVTRLTADGEQIVVRMVNPGDLFGFAKALQRPDYPGTARAAAESSMLAWPTTKWDYMVERYPSFAIETMQFVGQRLQEAHTRILELATEDAERRVAHAVLRLAKQAGKQEEDGISIDFPVSRQDIAEMTGTTLHTVSRILSAWAAEGLVKVGRQKLMLRDAHRLLLRADGRDKVGL